MKSVLTVSVAIIGLISLAPEFMAQRALGVLLTDLKSENWTKRADAMAGLSQNSGHLAIPTVRLELRELLSRETRLIEDLLRQGNGGAAARYGEGFAEYYSELLSAVYKTSNLRDPQALMVLAGSSYNPDSPFAQNLSDAGGAALIPIALELLKHDPDPRVWNGLGLLGRLYEKRDAHEFSASTAQGLKDAITGKTTATKTSIRSQAVRILGQIGTRGDLPLLRRIAETDSYSRPVENGRPQRFPIRDAARKSIEDIETRK
jgi:hypothetical protein